MRFSPASKDNQAGTMRTGMNVVHESGAHMWNNQRRQEEFPAKLDTQNAMLAQLHNAISELQRQAGEQIANAQQLQVEWVEHVARLQGQIEALKTQVSKQQCQVEELTSVNRGLERGVIGSDVWRRLPPDDTFWQTAHETLQPFYIPFTPEMELMLWISHARFPTLPTTSFVLPRSYARRAFVRIPESPNGEPQSVILSEADVDQMPDGYVVLLLSGYAAPPAWIETLLAFKTQEDLNMWLVWFEEDTSAHSNVGIRVAVACQKRNFDPEPIAPAEWGEQQVIYFERHPSQEMTIPIPRVSVIADDPSADQPRNDQAQETPAS